MEVVFTSLEALVLKATQECLPTPDSAAMDAFCAVMRDATEGPALAARALAARVHAGSSHESLLALSAIDHCMRRCDAAFHAEVGKFRFLNEMIKLVSPKYYADRTPPEVQLRILQLLHAWSIEYPKESKFKVAFDMLRSQGVVKATPPPLPPEPGAAPPSARPRAAAFEDDEKSKLLQKLLQSKNPVDLQFANKLIKNMVREEERRTEADSRRTSEVRQGVESARLLSSLLEQADDAGDDERQLMRELDEACRRHHAALLRLAATAQGDDGALDEILQASDELTEVIGKYQIIMAPRPAPPLLRDARPMNGLDNLLDFGAAGGEQPTRVADPDPMGDIFSTENKATGSVEPLKPFSIFSPEADITSGTTGSACVETTSGLAALDSLGAELLQRSLAGAPHGDRFPSKSAKKIPMNSIEKTSPPAEGAVAFDLDFLVGGGGGRAAPPPPPASPCCMLDDLMVDISMEPSAADCDTKQDIPSIKSTVAGESPNMTDLTGIHCSNKNDAIPKGTNGNLQPINLTDFHEILNLNDHRSVPNPSESPLPKTSMTLDKTLGVTLDGISIKPKEVSGEVGSRKYEEVNKKLEVRGLSDIDIPLASVQASSVPPLTILEEEEGLTVVLHIAANRPRSDVYVLVVSTTSRHRSPVSDYKFHAVVPKGCKVRTLPASGDCLPPYSAFLQPAAVIQLLLLARPPADPPAPVSLRFVVTYSCGGDTVTEMGEVPTLPLDHL